MYTLSLCALLILYFCRVVALVSRVGPLEGGNARIILKLSPMESLVDNGMSNVLVAIQAVLSQGDED